MSSVNAVATNNVNLLTVSAVNPVDSKTGTILELNENGGKIQENGTGIIRDFFHLGAQTQFIQGENVVYILITLPSERTIVQGIGKPPQ